MKVIGLLYELERNTDQQWDEMIAPSLCYSMKIVQSWNTVL